MASDPDAVVKGPLGTLDFELTDELAYQIDAALFDFQVRTVKAGIADKGSLHPALPLLVAFVMLAIAQAAALLWGGHPTVNVILLVLGCLVQLLLLFKFALYFWPAFAHWYLRRRSRRLVRGLSPRTIRWTFFEDRLETKSAQSQRSLPWTELKSVDVLADFWQLQYNPKLLLVVPTAVLSEELQEFVRRKAREVDAPFGS